MTNVEKILELIRKNCCKTMHEFPHTVGISYGVCQAILAENLDTRRIASADMSLKSTEFMTNNNNIVIIPQPLYSPGLAPCDFALFLELKMRLKVRCVETVSDIQRES
jgi:hypothetical protein